MVRTLDHIFVFRLLAIGMLSALPLKAAFSWNIVYNDVVNTTGNGFKSPTIFLAIIMRSDLNGLW